MEAKKKELELKRAAAASKGAKVFYKVTVKVGPHALPVSHLSTVVTLQQHVIPLRKHKCLIYVKDRPLSESDFGTPFRHGSAVACPVFVVHEVFVYKKSRSLSDVLHPCLQQHV